MPLMLVARARLARKKRSLACTPGPKPTQSRARRDRCLERGSRSEVAAISSGTDMSDDLQTRIEDAVKNPRNLGEMKDADAIGTVGSADCGDMLRMWVKFKEEGGRRVIDRATFQTFGCQTAIAVASVATEMLAGKTIAEARSMSGEELAAPLGRVAH